MIQFVSSSCFFASVDLLVLIFGVDSDKELDEEESSMVLNIHVLRPDFHHLLSLLKSQILFLGVNAGLKTAVFPNIPKMTYRVHPYFGLI